MISIKKTELARYIDHTLLKPEATPEDIVNLCREAQEFGFAAVCVNPCYIPTASRELAGTEVGVCAVVGFPLGASDPDIKAAEAAAAVCAGATEVDVVMNAGLFKGGLIASARADLEGVVRATRREKPGAIVKVILETCLLTENEKVDACLLAVSAGADFVKTSTGFGKGGATVSDVLLMKLAVGEDVGVKASGGIRDLPAALSMIEAGASRLGTSSGVSIVCEIER